MILSLKDISKSFTQGGKPIDVLKGVSLEVKKGEKLAISGPSGSGKSTLLSLMAGLDSPDRGGIFFKDKELTNFTEPQWTDFRASHLGIIFQQFHLLPHLSALDNVMLPLEILGTPDLQKAREALNSVQLSHRENHLPSQLSGGEQQRVAIARAIVTRPELLLADEPSGNLDTQTGIEVMNSLFSVLKEFNLTFILVTHNLDLRDMCDRSVSLINGELC